jgi:soluble lytic murein transglycosylase
MTRRRMLLVSLAVGCGLLFGALSVPRHRVADASLAAVYDPYAVAPLRPYGSFREAVRSGDALTLQRLAAGSDGYLAYRAALELARWKTIDAATRLAYYRRALRLRIDDPLARDEARALNLEAGRTAEQAGAVEAAVAYYRQALPLKGALEGLYRLVGDRRALAQDLLDARLYQDALDALGDLPDAPVRAQAELDLDHYPEALAAYRRWVAQAPGDATARGGLAWTLFYLGQDAEAGHIFSALPGANALYGRALIANRRGDVDTAVALLERTQRADDLWRATTLLEGKQRYADAIPIYLQLARGSSAYTDDAAYRAYVLAERLGMPDVARTAAALVPDTSFFALELGRHLDVPTPATPGSVFTGPRATAAAGGRATGAGTTGSTAGSTTGGRTAATATGPLLGEAPGTTKGTITGTITGTTDGAAGASPTGSAAATLQLARALVGVHDTPAAVGELLFELRAFGATTDASAPPSLDEAAHIVSIAQMLQSLDEYRQSVYAARELIALGSRSVEVWRLAYPTAYAPSVERQAAAAGISPVMVWAVMRKESAFSPVAVSRSDAMGLMQVTPPTWDWLGQLQGDTPAADPFDAAANIRYGTYYLGFLMRQFHGDQALAVASYNRGQGYIGRLFDGPEVKRNMNDLYRAIDSLETREYMQSVLLNIAVYRALYPGRFPAPGS